MKNTSIVSNSNILLRPREDVNRHLCDLWMYGGLWSVMSSVMAPDIILRGRLFSLTDTSLPGRPRASMNLQEHRSERHNLEKCSHTHSWVSLQTRPTDLDCAYLSWTLLYFFQFGICFNNLCSIHRF